VTIRRTHDLALIRAIFTHPTQYDAAGDDSAPRAEDFEPNADERIYYLLVRSDEGLIAGIVTLVPENCASYQIHIAVLPSAWGKATDYLRAAIAWSWIHTPARRIVARIPVYNRLALALARRAGLAEYGRNAGSFLKRGRLWDTVDFGISPQL
jgi:RimJ/RimL family protein N-acetyltransferase